MIHNVRILFLVIVLLRFFCIEARADNTTQQVRGQGIKWISGLTWDQIKEKAQNENKYIFVDCFATWCQPCKLMDEAVFKQDRVCNLLNENFISVKVQMDVTKNDNEEIRKWYSTVDSIKKDYSVNAMPTFLFFAPDGELVHKDVGGKNVEQFISLVSNATNPDNQYYTLIRSYKEGNLDVRLMPMLAKMALSLDDMELSNQIARSYMTEYLCRDEQRVFTKETQKFIYNFYGMIRSSDRLFQLYLLEPNRMDSLLGEAGDSKRIVDFVITKEDIIPEVALAKKQNKSPAWKNIYRRIDNKYGRVYAERNTINARVDFYKSEQDWTQYAKYLIQKVEAEAKYNDVTNGNEMILNENAWEIFMYSNHQDELEKALKWSENSLLHIDKASFNVGAYMDTYANLLYKLGRTKKAIEHEEKALQRVTVDAERYNFIKSSIKDYQKTLLKMKNGEPTHLEHDAKWSKASRKRVSK